MECKNHNKQEAIDRCVGCAEGFCENCLVEINGQHYCGECKYMTVEGPPVIENPNRVKSKEAKSALTHAIVGLFIFGIFLGPIAISKGIDAKQKIESNPNLSGIETANAAILLGIIALLSRLIMICHRII